MSLIMLPVLCFPLAADIHFCERRLRTASGFFARQSCGAHNLQELQTLPAKVLFFCTFCPRIFSLPLLTAKFFISFVPFDRKRYPKLPQCELSRVRSFVERLRMLRKFVNKLSPSHFVRLHSELILKVRGAVYLNPRYPRGVFLFITFLFART
ncbi:MAG: hypothetical protein J6K28_04680 [Alistipes sp.]|nr:hypothetical protein [Alistipes sp.]